ncbi:MAG: tetratricopeptide repeat protein [Saprospirales bacterium]|nr:MAG: tetratricopeptide repeat protein [Saprospirales bacterium]
MAFFQYIIFPIKILFVLMIAMGLSVCIQAQEGVNLKAEGDRLFLKGQYEAAEEKYRTVPESKQRPELWYNLGNALYKQGRYGEAKEFFERAAQSLELDDQSADAWFNMGNSLFEDQDFESAMESYRKALLQNPDHHEARNNLMLSKMMIQEMPPQPEPEDFEEEVGDSPDADKMAETGPDEDGMEEDMPDAEGMAQMEDEQQEAEGEDEMDESDLETIDRDRLEQLLQLAEMDDMQTRRRMNERQSDRGQTLKDW